MATDELASAKASFERAITFLRSGDAATAEGLARAALKDHPQDANFLTVLGAALTQQHRASEAEVVLRQALASDPDYAKAHEELGRALLAQDRADEAVEPLRRAFELNPAMETAQAALSRALLAAGREQEAKEVFDAFLRQQPHRQLLAQGAEHQREGRLEQAESVYREILRQDPRNVTALRMLGLLAMRLEHYRDAALLLEQAVTIAPDFHVAWLDLGRAQTETYELEKAITSMHRAIALDPGRASGYLGLANALSRSSRTEDAIKAYQQAIALRPGQAGSYLGLGNVLKTVGRQSEAIAAYREGIRLKPDYAELYWSLSNLKTFRFDPVEIAAMERHLDKVELPEDAAIHFCFALGKACDDQGNYDRAFGYYERGNSLRRRQEHYDPVHTEHIGERIRGVFSREFLQQHAGAGYSAAAPIFIVGLPRSGSTLIEQILASHSQVEATFELPEAGRLIRFIDRQRLGGKVYPEAVANFPGELYAELGRRYDRETRRYRAGAPRFIDKMPNNFATIGLLHLILPNARFINSQRHPLDTCLSCYRQLFARGQSFTYDLNELGEYYLEYQRMINHWHAVLPGRVLEVRYEDIVADLEGQTRRMLEFCDLPWADSCLRFHETQRAIRSASSEQVRKPLYSDAVGHWRHYEAHLGSLMETLAPVVPD
jgi:tetratricopeptide (TPR) repeat protein